MRLWLNRTSRDEAVEFTRLPNPFQLEATKILLHIAEILALIPFQTATAAA